MQLLRIVAPSGSMEIPLTLRLSPEAQKSLALRAAAGRTLSEYVSLIVEHNALDVLPLEEISGPVYKRFLESGVSDEQLSDELEKGRHELGAERRARGGK